jgi:hypothetical protein
MVVLERNSQGLSSQVSSLAAASVTSTGQLEYASRELRTAKGLPVEGDISKVCACWGGLGTGRTYSTCLPCTRHMLFSLECFVNQTVILAEYN